jgi:pSer/pThr/pTyr-binding forkhead associated (FHA) protein
VGPNCRTCPKRMRERCIEESANSPSVKMMIHRAFAAGTDTEQMWRQLQVNCLLMPKKGAPRPSQAPAAEELRGREGAAYAKDATPPPSTMRAPTYSKDATPPPSSMRAPTYTKDATPPPPTTQAPARTKDATPPPPSSVRAPESVRKPPPKTSASRFSLVLAGGNHRIALPAEGQIVLGRYDPATTANPDVDLSYDDRRQRAISRRHARIIAHQGHHLIEDMGSTNGTMVNMQRLKIGQKVMLQPGDRVLFGDHRFYYRPAPEMQAIGNEPLQAYLRGTFTGRRYPLPPFGEIIVGRSDRTVRFAPDIDLAGEEEASLVVARRHVKISARENRHYVEDMGSANGTKLNGVVLHIGERGLLEPGDHLWLGGCVLAYDVDL